MMYDKPVTPPVLRNMKIQILGLADPNAPGLNPYFNQCPQDFMAWGQVGNHGLPSHWSPSPPDPPCTHSSLLVSKPLVFGYLASPLPLYTFI